MVEVSILVPTYNEKDVIRPTIESIVKYTRKKKIDTEILVIDDSTDETYQTLRKLQYDYRELKVIHREKKKGVGSAIRDGIRKCAGKYVIIFMADGPLDVIYFEPILENLRSGFDMVQTSFFRSGAKIVRYPSSKIAANRIFNWLLRIAFLRPDMTVFTSLFKGARKDVLNDLDLESDGFEIGIEIALKCCRKRAKIKEIAVNFMDRTAGKTKLNLRKEGFRYMWRAMRIWLTYW